MAKPEKLRLGRKTIALLVDYLESNYTWSQLRQLLFEHGLDARFYGPNKLAALQNVFFPLIGENADPHELGNTRELLEELARSWHQTIKKHEEDEFSVPSYEYEHAAATYYDFQRALRADGLDLVEGRVASFVSTSVEVAQEQGALEARLRRFGFKTSLRHLEQAIENASRGNWEAANSQIGSFLESLCEEIAARLHSGLGNPPTRGEARMFLENSGFLDKAEAELLKSFFKVLHSPGGRHAGTSSEDDCHRRRLMAVALANYYLERLEFFGSRGEDS